MSTLPRTPRVLLTALGLAALVVTGVTCGGDGTGPSKPVITSLVRVSGDGQTGPAAQALPTKLAVKVLDQNGAPMAGVAVAWTVRTGGGSISATSPTTDAAGLNSATWTLGPTAGEDTVSARLPAATAITPVTFAATAVAGTPAALAVTGQPSPVTAGAAISPAVRVTIQDAQGNTVTTANTPLTVAISAGTGAAGATLSGTRTRSAVAGVATFDDLSIDKAGTGYSLTVTGGGLPSAATTTFAVNPGAVSASQSSVAASPASITAGGSGSTVTVTAKDANGNPVSGATVVVAATGSGNGIVGPLAPTNASGVATATLTSTAVGTKIVSATVNAVAITQTDTVTVTAGAAATFVVTGLAADTAGASQSPTVEARDAHGNRATGYLGSVSFSSNDGQAALPSPYTFQAADAGIHTFTSAVRLRTAGTQTLTVTDQSNATITGSESIAVSPASITAGHSVVSASNPTVASGATVTLTLQAKDQYGNALTTGGATVAFSASGGTSTESIGSTTDHLDGTYTAAFTGLLAGTADTIHATVNGAPVTTAPPTVAVTPGTPSAATSIVTVSSATVASSSTDTLRLQAKDANGNTVTTGGATVVFSASGGTSTGSIGTTTDRGDGTYTALFTGMTAGTATTIHATIGGASVTTTLPGITVTTGPLSAAQSTVSASPSSISADGGSTTITVTAKDAHNNPIAGATVVLASTGTGNTVTQPAGTTDASGVATGSVSSTVAEGKTVSATINAVAITQTAAVTVTPGAISAGQSVVNVSSGTVASGATVTLTLQGKDAHGNALTTGGSTVVFTATGGTSTESIGATTDHLNGTYTAVLTGILAGTADTIHATIGGVQVTTTLPTVTVTPGTPSSSQSVVTLRNDSLVSADTMTATLQVKDAAGNPVPGRTVVFTQGGGTSTVTIGSTTDHGDGGYTALLTGLVAGTATGIGATIDGTAVTSTKPTLLVTPGRATRMVFTQQPTAAAPGATISPAVVIQALDAAGNIDPLYDNPNGIVLDIESGTGTSGAVLTGGSALANKGVTTFSGLSIDLAGTGYKLRATILTLGGYSMPPILSVAFNIGP